MFVVGAFGEVIEVCLCLPVFYFIFFHQRRQLKGEKKETASRCCYDRVERSGRKIALIREESCPDI